MSGSTLSPSLLNLQENSIAALDPRFPNQLWVWIDAAGNIGASIDTNGALTWSVLRAETLSATSAKFDNFALDSLALGDDMLGALDPRIPGYRFVLTDMAGNIAAGLDDNGVWQANVTVESALPLTGGTMTGPLVLDADPAVALEAATKQYVDAAAGGAFGGFAFGGSGGSGLAGLTAIRAYPYPPMRDPKRDYGAVGDGVTDDSAAINACVAAALAAGERLIAVNDPLNVPTLDVSCGDLVFIGTGTILNSPIWKYVIPPFAPAPTQPTSTLNIRAHCPNFCTTLKAGHAVAVLTGDSFSTPLSNGLTSQAVLWSRLRYTMNAANPGKTITWYNRGIGAGTWGMLDTVHVNPSAVSWYYDPARAWLDYIEDLAPDILFINFASNDGTTFRYSQLLSVMSKLAEFAKPPDIVLVTSNPYAEHSATDPEQAAAFMNGAAYCAGFMRSWCLAHGIGLIDTARVMISHILGLDCEDIPLIRDLAPTGGLITTHAAIPLPFTWPTKCFGYGGYFYVASAADWASLGNEVQFELSPQTTNASRNAGNLFRVGRDVATGNIYFQMDTTLTTSGAEQSETFIGKTVVTGWSTSVATGFQFSVVGSGLIFTSSLEQDQYIIPLIGPVPRFAMPWQPKITCNAGTVSNKLTWGLTTAGNALALSANPHPRTLAMPTMTDFEAHGSLGSVDTWGGLGTGHASTLSGVLAIQSVLNTCDFSVV